MTRIIDLFINHFWKVEEKEFSFGARARANEG